MSLGMAMPFPRAQFSSVTESRTPPEAPSIIPEPPLPAPHTRVGVGGVLIRRQQVLVNRAVYRPYFTIPSGYVEPGESLEQAVVREVLEETGVRTRVGRLVLSRHKVLDATESDAYFAFLLDFVSGRAEARLPEIVEVREPSVEEALTGGWISDLSRLAIRVAASGLGWPRGYRPVGPAAGLAYETFHPVP